MILGRTALVLIISFVIAAAPLVSTSLSLSRSDGPAYAAVVAAPALQDDNEADESDNDESDNDESDNGESDNDESDNGDADLFGADNDESDNGTSGSNILDLNSNAALGSDNDSGGDNDNDSGLTDNEDSGNDNGDNGNDNDGTPNSLTGTNTVTACLEREQQIALTVPEGQVLFRNSAKGEKVQATLTRIDLAAQPVPAPPPPGARLGGTGGLVFSVTAGKCGAAGQPTVPGSASLSVQYTEAAAAGLNKGNLKLVSLSAANVWTAVPNQRNGSQDPQPTNEVVAELGATGTFSVHTVSP